MATPILRETHNALVEEMNKIEKQIKDTSVKIRDAAAQGDLSENAEYDAAKELQAMLVSKKQLMNSHTPFRIVDPGDITTDEVSFGTKVTIQQEGKGKEEDYYLLGPIEFELDLYPLIVTSGSPFGRAVVGKKVGEHFTLEIRGEETKFTITAIDKIPKS